MSKKKERAAEGVDERRSGDERQSDTRGSCITRQPGYSASASKKSSGLALISKETLKTEHTTVRL